MEAGRNGRLLSVGSRRINFDRSVGHVLIDTDVELSNVTETHIWNRMNSVRRNGRRNSKWDAEENVR